MPLVIWAAAFGSAASGVADAAEVSSREITIDLALAERPLDRFFNQSVGSDFPGTLIRPDSQAHLKLAVDELGFRYIRFHDIFHDALGTVQVVDGRTVYDWTRIDQLYDDLLSKGIRPFIELGFTPKAMTTSEQTLFYWKGNTSHPKLEPWRDLVDAFVRHLRERYGVAEVRHWYFEVWNEPNLGDFWERADQQAYFKLYDVTARTIKAIDPTLQVGGPATAGAAWVPEFLEYAHENGVPVDFVTTHTYGVDGGFLDENGESDTKLLSSPDAIVGDVRRVREQIDASPFPSLPLYITEWSTSYTPRDAVHDSYVSAPYILDKIKAAQGLAQGMSYWAYTDLFEEPGPPPTPFHGGFGLINREGVRKPAFFAYKYLHALRGKEIPSSDAESLLATDGASTSALIWNWTYPEQDVSNRPFYTRLVPASPVPAARLTFKHLTAGAYRLQVKRTGFRANDAYSAYIEMGAPASLSDSQLEKLHELTRDLPETDRRIEIGPAGEHTLEIPMRSNDVVLVTLTPESGPPISP
ncbi:GH39 family glycosyl hydrolase [Marilutibacter alkalisoli]|uniref:GH39 family glycosyl hydrolase n=1 Tax=Marilutibacter alkalisoli TaxID=2591633 RepID=UPI00387E4CC9